MRTAAAGVFGVALWSASALAADKVTFLTSWFAQAEHGGFYQAKATGLYEKAGLDVTLKMGGPQVNGVSRIFTGQHPLHNDRSMPDFSDPFEVFPCHSRTVQAGCHIHKGHRSKARYDYIFELGYATVTKKGNQPRWMRQYSRQERDLRKEAVSQKFPHAVAGVSLSQTGNSSINCNHQGTKSASSGSFDSAFGSFAAAQQI